MSNQVEKRASNEIEDGAYFKMNTTQNSSDDIIETQRTIIVPQKDGTEKKSVVKYSSHLIRDSNASMFVAWLGLDYSFKVHLLISKFLYQNENFV